ncbi:MAG TPA: diguanylate cyclase [Aquabacterium sp.]|uniref:GGDEF domain-containing protein n=1 Tax=Aquabacterium sp. TaxID=1872578 RepID=UPI002E326DAE|nr:diguanylate cyclase [Aquabacterium sp.]HEX5354766.1 diguanylate cyclase [Aquabacterium sp.]
MTQFVPPAQPNDPIVDAVGKLVHSVFGHDRATRARTAAILLCAIMYAICCSAAYYAAEINLMRPFAPKLLWATSMPAYVAFYTLVRFGKTRHLKDPTLMLPQNVFALLAIAFAYTAVGPHDRGVVLVLIALVMVFGMYTHTPKQSVQIGVLAMLLLGLSMGVLAHIDPDYYPPDLELLRFELMLGTVPTLIFSAYQISSWRNRLSAQRKDLKIALEQVQQMATHDVLTGLYNRRFMQDRLEDAVKRFERYGERFTVVLIDLDHFKRVNDQFGHKVGDQALMAFANASGIVLRETDIIARWGGEEFIFLLPNTAAEKALVALERLRQTLASCTVSENVPQLRVKFSAGVAVHDSVTSLTHTLERADKALYQAKSSGRDRDVTAPPDKP